MSVTGWREKRAVFRAEKRINRTNQSSTKIGKTFQVAG